jgi:hypothetical protein
VSTGPSLRYGSGRGLLHTTLGLARNPQMGRQEPGWSKIFPRAGTELQSRSKAQLVEHGAPLRFSSRTEGHYAPALPWPLTRTGAAMGRRSNILCGRGTRSAPFVGSLSRVCSQGLCREKGG